MPLSTATSLGGVFHTLMRFREHGKALSGPWELSMAKANLCSAPVKPTIKLLNHLNQREALSHI